MDQTKKVKIKKRFSIQQFPHILVLTSKIVRFSTNSKAKTKQKKKIFSSKIFTIWFSSPKSCNFQRILKRRPTKKRNEKESLRPKIYAKFHEIRCESTKITKKQFLLTNSWAISTILGVYSICTPIAPSLLISFWHSPCLGGTSSHLGGTVSECPLVAPDLIFFW